MDLPAFEEIEIEGAKEFMRETMKCNQEWAADDLSHKKSGSRISHQHGTAEENEEAKIDDSSSMQSGNTGSAEHRHRYTSV